MDGFMLFVVALVWLDGRQSGIDLFSAKDRYVAIQKIASSGAIIEPRHYGPVSRHGQPCFDSIIAATLFGIERVRFPRGATEIPADAVGRCGPIRRIQNLPGAVAGDSLEEILQNRSIRLISLCDCEADEAERALKLICKSQTIEAVILTRSNVSASALRAIWTTPNLQRFSSYECTLDSLGFVEVELAENLTEVSLVLSDFDTKGLRFFAESPSISRINLSYSLQHAKDLLAFERLHSLRLLVLQGCAVSDADAAVFLALPHVRELHLNSTAIGDAVMNALACLDSIEVLEISDTCVSNAGVACLETTTKMRELGLENTAVDATCLDSLVRMRSLGKVRCSLPIATMDRLASARPDVDCGIDRPERRSKVGTSAWRRWMQALKQTFGRWD